jgi:PIN domain nuclease of toxin-antitoxin system
MNLLFDSHAVLWWLSNDARMSQMAHDALCDTDNGACISAVSFWELSIKISIGKLQMPSNWVSQLCRRMSEDAVDYLHLQSAHCEIIQSMPFYHRDPFDRMLAAQTQCEALTLISRDAIFDRYGVERLW